MLVISSMTHQGMVILPLSTSDRASASAALARTKPAIASAEADAEPAARRSLLDRALRPGRTGRGARPPTRGRRRTPRAAAARSSRRSSPIRGRSVEGVAERVEGAAQVRLHRVRRHAERGRDVVDRQLLEVAQRDAVALAAGQAAHGLDAPGGAPRSGRATSATSSSTSISRPAAAWWRSDIEPAPVVVAGEVEHDRAQVRRRPIDRRRSGRRGGRGAGTPPARCPRPRRGRRRTAGPAAPASGPRSGTARPRAARRRPRSPRRGHARRRSPTSAPPPSAPRARAAVTDAARRPRTDDRPSRSARLDDGDGPRRDRRTRSPFG